MGRDREELRIYGYTSSHNHPRDDRDAALWDEFCRRVACLVLAPEYQPLNLHMDGDATETARPASARAALRRRHQLDGAMTARWASDAERERTGDPHGNVPVQAWGTWRGLGWYFRARHDSWTWKCPDLPWGDDSDPDAAWFLGGDWFNSGWMDHEDARLLIARAIAWAERHPAGGDCDLTDPCDPQGEMGPLEDPQIRAARDAEFWAVVNSLPKYDHITGITTPGVPLSAELEKKYATQPGDE